MNFLPKCSTVYVLKEKGKKGMAPEEKGMAQHHAKTGWGNTNWPSETVSRMKVAEEELRQSFQKGPIIKLQ